MIKIKKRNSSEYLEVGCCLFYILGRRLKALINVTRHLQLAVERIEEVALRAKLAMSIFAVQSARFEFPLSCISPEPPSTSIAFSDLYRVVFLCWCYTFMSLVPVNVNEMKNTSMEAVYPNLLNLQLYTIHI